MDLEWRVLIGNQRLDFDESRVTREDANNLFTVSVTTPFLFRDESLMPVTVQCVASRSDSGLYLSNATALAIYNGSTFSFFFVFPQTNGCCVFLYICIHRCVCVCVFLSMGIQ